MLRVNQLSGFGQGSLYRAQAVVFDGTNDVLTKAADFTGDADAKVGMFSFWINFSAGNGVSQFFFINAATAHFYCYRFTDNKWHLDGFNAAGTQILAMTTTGTYTTSAGWHHVMMAWNLATAAGYAYVNDASDLAGGSTLTNDTLDYTGAGWDLGQYVAGSTARLLASVADLYLNLAAFVDISVESTRRKFISASRKPVFLGSDGSLPTGTAPILFLSNPAASFQTNRGTGGGFTVTGALTDATTSPSD